MGKTTTYSFIDMSGVKQRSLLPQGEGQDEGIYKTMSYLLLIPSLCNRDILYILDRGHRLHFWCLKAVILRI